MELLITNNPFFIYKKDNIFYCFKRLEEGELEYKEEHGMDIKIYKEDLMFVHKANDFKTISSILLEVFDLGKNLLPN